MVDTSGAADATADAQLGARLRAAREQAGLGIEACASALRARRTQLEALEAGQFENFGGDIYARGFIRSYALHLGLDPAELLALHGRDPAVKAPTLTTLPSSKGLLGLDRRVPVWALVVVGLVVSGVILGTVSLLGGARTPPVAQPIDVPVAPLPPVSEPPVRPQPAPEPVIPEPVRAPVELVLIFEGDSWLETLVDGVVVDGGRLVCGGETLRFEARERVNIFLGDPGRVRAELNGVDLGIQGTRQVPIRIAYGPDGPIA
jgi:cytoskeleton protein RodZ